MRVGPGAVMLGFLAVALAGAAIVGLQQDPGRRASAGPTAATDVCQLPDAWVPRDGGAAGTPAALVQQDVGGYVAVYAMNGPRTVVCEAHRNGRGVFDFGTSGVGGVDPVDGTALTYDTSIGLGSSAKLAVVAGRTPAGTARVEVVAADGVRTDAAVAHGLYVARLDGADRVARIVARDSSGGELARLEDPVGLTPPAVSP